MAVLHSAISWCSGTLSPMSGCTRVSEGCRNCYAEALFRRLPDHFGHGFGQVALHLDRLALIRKMRPHIAPDGTRSPFLCFVNSISDFWHAAVPDAAVHQCLDAFEAYPTTVFQILTKRPLRARKILTDRYRSGIPANIWIGVSVENNDVRARLDILRSIRERTGGDGTFFASVEPIVGPTDQLDFAGIDWIITGGESGGNARIMERRWLMPAIEQALGKDIALWHKQSGTWASHPNLPEAPAGLGIKAKAGWLIENGWEVLPEEKGGGTVDRKTYRAMPPAFYAMSSEMNAGHHAA